MLQVYVCAIAHELLFCDALKAALRTAQYQTSDDLESNPPDVVIVPIDSVEGSCRLISHIIDQRPATTVVAIGEQCEEEAIVALIEAGAKAYVDRSQSVAQLLFSIDAVVQQRAPASGRITAQVIRKIQCFRGETASVPGIGALTAREQTILNLIARGCTNKQIADDLAISSNTVKNHIHRILDKLHVRRRREAARMALSSAYFPAPVQRQKAAPCTKSA